jgi:hypothetical protein
MFERTHVQEICNAIKMIDEGTWNFFGCGYYNFRMWEVLRGHIAMGDFSTSFLTHLYALCPLQTPHIYFFVIKIFIDIF